MRSSSRRRHGAAGTSVLIGARGWCLLGLAGSLAVAIAGPAVSGGTVRWWFHPHVLWHAGQVAILWCGAVAVVIAWLGVGAHVRGTREVQHLWVLSALWALPLTLTAPLFSHDVYSYLAQGGIVHLGANPYRDPPTILAALGHRDLLRAVDPFWRSTRAPYGPLFLAIAAGIQSLSGSGVVLGALLLKAVELAGLGLLAVFVPRLARALGADPAKASWLVALNPLVMLSLLAAGHNDLLMTGILVAGVAVALEHRPLLGLAICALAATIKVPAAAGAVFVAVSWAKAEPDWPRRLAVLARSAAAVLAVLAFVSLTSGLGLSWVSGSVFSSPAKVHLAITPATAISWSASKAAGAIGIKLSFRHLDSTLLAVGFGLACALGLALLVRADRRRLVGGLGLTLVVFALCGPAAWPWYLIWGVALLAAGAGERLARGLVVTSIVAALIVKPDGILLLPLHTAPIVLAVYVALAIAVYVRRASWAAGTPVGAPR